MTTQPEQIQEIPLKSLRTSRQVREQFDEDSLRGLAASLEVGSLQQPIRVRQTAQGYVIVDGERRSRAAKLAGWTSIPAIVESKTLSEAEILQKQIIANVQRADLTPLEKARGMQRLKETTGWTATQVSEHLGLSNATVSRLLKLLTLPAEIQTQIEAGAIPSSAGYELSCVTDSRQQAEMAAKIANGQLSRDDLQAERKANREPKQSTATGPKPQRVTAQLGTDRAVSVTAIDLTLEHFIGLLEELVNKARKVRSRGIELPTFIRILNDEAKGAK